MRAGARRRLPALRVFDDDAPLAARLAFPPDDEGEDAEVIDLMEALKRSVAARKSGKGSAASSEKKAPAKKPAAKKSGTSSAKKPAAKKSTAKKAPAKKSAAKKPAAKKSSAQEKKGA